jgi:hypothetical protein
MENKNISQIALERIREEGIKPISRNVFSLKRVLFWVVVASSFVVGAFAFSLVLSALFNNDWYLYDRFGLNFIFRTLPYFWLVSLAVFTILGEYYYRKTLLGHRRGFLVIIGIYLISTSLFGSIFYLVGVGGFIEESLENNISSYRGIILNRYEIWSHPEEGLLSGKITKVSDGEVEIIDKDGYIWIVNVGKASAQGKEEIDVDERVKITGKVTSNNNFSAEDIRPWKGMR